MDMVTDYYGVEKKFKYLSAYYSNTTWCMTSKLLRLIDILVQNNHKQN